MTLCVAARTRPSQYYVTPGPLESEMDDYVERENIVRYRKLISACEGDPSRDEARYETLLRLLAEAVAKQDEAPLK